MHVVIQSTGFLSLLRSYPQNVIDISVRGCYDLHFLSSHHFLPLAAYSRSP